MWFDSQARNAWLWGELAVLLILLVLALPSRRVEDLDPGVEVAQWDELVPVQRWTAAIPLPVDHHQRVSGAAGPSTDPDDDDAPAFDPNDPDDEGQQRDTTQFGGDSGSPEREQSTAPEST